VTCEEQGTGAVRWRRRTIEAVERFARNGAEMPTGAKRSYHEKCI